MGPLFQGLIANKFLLAGEIKIEKEYMTLLINSFFP
jgi:hypothetical protein